MRVIPLPRGDGDTLGDDERVAAGLLCVSLELEVRRAPLSGHRDRLDGVSKDPACRGEERVAGWAEEEGERKSPIAGRRRPEGAVPTSSAG